jgi:hypothetical protein
MLRHCGRCERLGREAWKDESEFAQDKNHSSGRARQCKQCMREQSAAWRAEHPDASYPKTPEQNRRGVKAYYERKRATGWRKSRNKWIKEEGD